MTDGSVFETVLASTVHDMKNSLSLLMGQLDTISERLALDSENQQAVSGLRYEANRINVSLMELLTLYRLEKKQIGIHVVEVIMADFIEDCFATHSILAASKGINLDMDCDDSLIWFFDPDLMGIAINNIIGNSIRYTQSCVLVSVNTRQDSLVIQIDDDGAGYPQSMLTEAENFTTKIDSSTGSTGLGLFFAETIASKHKRLHRQGSTQLKNGRLLSGGSFRIVLP